MREIAKRTKLKLARARKASQNDSKSVLSSFFSFFCCPFAFEPIRAPFAAPLFRPFSKAMTAPRSPRRASAGGGLPVTVSPARESAPPHGGAAGGREKRRGLIVLALAAVGCLFLISLSSSSTSGLGGASLASPSGTTTRNSRRLLNTGEGEECAGIGVEGGAATCVLELDSRRNSFGPHPKISSSASFQKTARRDQSDFFGFSLSLSCSLSFLLPPFNEPASEPCPPRRSGVSDLRKACLVYENSLSFFEKAPTFFLSKSLKKNSPSPLPPTAHPSRPRPPSPSSSTPPPPPPQPPPRSLPLPPSSRASPGSTPTETPSRPTGDRPCARPTAPTGGTARTSPARATRRRPAATGGSTPSASPPTGPATWCRGTAPLGWRWRRPRRSRT